MGQPKAAKGRTQPIEWRQDLLAPLSGSMAPVTQQPGTDIKRIGMEQGNEEGMCERRDPQQFEEAFPRANSRAFESEFAFIEAD